MNSNKLKLIACISMFIDHLGYYIFPEITVLRYIGRLAMPIFAFFIAEGCRHTKNKFKYFCSVFLLGILCQAVYIIKDFGLGFVSMHLNVLFTLALAIPLCCLFLKLESGKNGYTVLFLGYLAALIALCWVLDNSANLFGVSLSIDYSIAGILLCFMPILCKEKTKRLAAFSVGLVVYCLLMQRSLPYIWYSVLSIPLIALYNGKRGSKSYKYAFYLFYPLHLALIYGLRYLI